MESQLGHLQTSDHPETPCVAEIDPPEGVPHFSLLFYLICMKNRRFYGISVLVYSEKAFPGKRTGPSPTLAITWLCFELEQIQGHFYSWDPPMAVGKSGLGFAVSLSIKKLGLWREIQI